MLMYEYFINADDIKKISLGSIKYMTNQLDMFLSLYEKNILVISKEEVEIINKLKQVVQILKEGRFNELINNPDLMIDFMDDDEDYYPKYVPF